MHALRRGSVAVPPAAMGLTAMAALLVLLAAALVVSTAAPGNSCVGHCGRWAEHCWCNDECVAHGDCCADYRAACGGGDGGGSGTVTTRYVLVGGRNRSYELQIPRNSSKHTALPVILVFHGDGGTAAAQAADDHYRDVAGDLAFVVHLSLIHI